MAESKPWLERFTKHPVSFFIDEGKMMNISTNGMLFVASDIDVSNEDEFNDWYDHEHIEERARIEGFISAARYKSVKGGKRYLGLYRTGSLEAFTSPAYKAAFGKQTAWSVTNLNRMVDPMRRVSAVSAVVGQGSGSSLAVLSIKTNEPEAALISQFVELGKHLSQTPGFVQSYLLIPDHGLSSPLPRENLEGRCMQPLFIVETSSAEANETLQAEAINKLGAIAQDTASYALNWKLYSAELSS